MNDEEVKSDIQISVINWFPGHMTKAKREMQEKLKMVDLIIELRDARIPKSSKNPLIDEISNQKPRLILLSKNDKAVSSETNKWIKVLSEEEYIKKVIAVNIISDNMTKIISEAANEIMKDKIERQIRRGIKPRAIRAMVVGVPNVGKSTLINRIAKKKAVQAANRPGVTRALQWVKVTNNLELLDTPGVLWPKFDDQMTGINLAVTGAIRDEILPLDQICLYAIDYLTKNYVNALENRYGIKIANSPYETFLAIAKERNCYLANEVLDEKRCIQMIMKDIRNDAMGSITWELVDEN